MDYRALFSAAALKPEDCDVTQFCDGLRAVIAGVVPSRELPTIAMINAASRALLGEVALQGAKAERAASALIECDKVLGLPAVADRREALQDCGYLSAFGSSEESADVSAPESSEESADVSAPESTGDSVSSASGEDCSFGSTFPICTAVVSVEESIS